jgi:hypothetical protein
MGCSINAMTNLRVEIVARAIWCRAGKLRAGLCPSQSPEFYFAASACASLIQVTKNLAKCKGAILKLRASAYRARTRLLSCICRLMISAVALSGRIEFGV